MSIREGLHRKTPRIRRSVEIDSRRTSPHNTNPTAQDMVHNNAALSRYELDVDGATAFASYRLAPGKVIITHTETPRALRGRGIASRLVQGALEQIRADGLKVVAGCGFVVDYLEKHPEFSDVAA